MQRQRTPGRIFNPSSGLKQVEPKEGCKAPVGGNESNPRRIPLECDLQHLCPKLCYEDCGNCETLIERNLPCGHVKILQCHVNYEKYHCLESVEVELPHCGHKVRKLCYQDIATCTCSIPCPYRLPCGHSCTQNCHVLLDPDHLEFKCKKPCTKKNAGCVMDHMCTKLCHEECGLCSTEVEKKLPQCNHHKKIRCSEDPANVQCRIPCTKIMICGHQCQKNCYEECGGCQEKVKKIIPSCGHEISKIKCCVIPTQSLCRRPCERLLQCGHSCVRSCGQRCAEECYELINCPFMPLCGHNIQIPCYLQKNADPNTQLILQFCEAPCGATLSCNHKCKGRCGECMQGRIHVACDEKCNRSLICGHKCSAQCAAFCPPCFKKCRYKCNHFQCKLKCGEPCEPCKKLCTWKCEHLQCTKLCREMCDRDPCYEPCKKKLNCGHSCIGFCGDICPPLCRICNEKEVKQIYFGSKDDKNARFVYLVDCKHTVESESLEKWLQQSDNEITLKTCPQCKTFIMRTERFMKFVKLTLCDVSRVKRQLSGKRKPLLFTERGNLSRSLEEHSSLFQHHMKLKSKSYAGMLEICNDQLKLVRNNHSNYLSREEMQSMKSQIEIFDDLLTCILIFIIKPNVTLKTEISEKLFHQFDCMVEKMKQRRCNFTAQETSDFNRECKRFYSATQLAVLESSNNFLDSQTQIAVREFYEKACSILQSIKIYTDENHAELTTLIKSLKKSIGNTSLIDHERKEITQAIGFKEGHWLKCPNGHIYCIGDGNGLMQEAKCPECERGVGGTKQLSSILSTILSPNAPETDGAARQAFQGGFRRGSRRGSRRSMGYRFQRYHF